MRLVLGTISRSNCSRLPVDSSIWMEMSVTLPPGRPRLATNPSFAASVAGLSTIGTLCVSRLAAVPALLPVATMTSTFKANNAAMRSSNGAPSFSGARTSYCTFLPSTYSSACIWLKKTSHWYLRGANRPPGTTPTRQTLPGAPAGGCCATAPCVKASPLARTLAPSAVISWRRWVIGTFSSRRLHAAWARDCSLKYFTTILAALVLREPGLWHAHHQSECHSTCRECPDNHRPRRQVEHG